jgi:NitT/TauT family transport system permease protein
MPSFDIGYDEVFVADAALMGEVGRGFAHILSTLHYSRASLAATVTGCAQAAVDLVNPFVVASQVVPKVALAPLFVVWFGFGDVPKIVIAAVLAFFPIFTNSVLGVKSIDLGHRDAMTSLNASGWARFRRLELPSAPPYVLTGMEVGIVLAVIGCVVAQFIGGDQGLGYLLIATMNAYQIDLLFAVIVLLTAIGFLFYLVIGALRRIVIPWQESTGQHRA